ncbi:MAG TPA: hypothetical protein VJ438_03165 [Candidatus Nanoarchaeia archaeon]|nr:hypothetical protein [Candidatus Nanoarchaeia archaeon]
MSDNLNEWEKSIINNLTKNEHDYIDGKSNSYFDANLYLIKSEIFKAMQELWKSDKCAYANFAQISMKDFNAILESRGIKERI